MRGDVENKTDWASVTALARDLVHSAWRADCANTAVPNRKVGRTSLTDASSRVFVRQSDGAAAEVGGGVPDVRGVAGDALTGEGVEIGASSGAEATSSGGVEDETSRAALTGSSGEVPVVVSGA